MQAFSLGERARAADVEHDDFRRPEQPHRRDGGPKPGGNNHVAATFDDVAIDFLHAEFGLRVAFRDDRQIDLAAVRMAAKRQRHALRNPGKYEGFVRQQENATMSVSPEVLETCSEELLTLLGFRSWMGLGSVDGANYGVLRGRPSQFSRPMSAHA